MKDASWPTGPRPTWWARSWITRFLRNPSPRAAGWVAARRAGTVGRVLLSPREVSDSLRTMADVKVRNLDESVARALRSRAKSRGVTLEEEVRRSLAETVALRQKSFARRAAACRAATGGGGDRRPTESAVIIRRERDAWG